MKRCVAADGRLDQIGQVHRVAAAAQLDEKLAWPLLIARSDPIADASLPEMRARSSPAPRSRR